MNARLSGVMLTALSQARQDVLVELWEVDLRGLGGQVYRFCNQTNELGKAVVWQGQAYEPYPVYADGFENTAQGAGNRPSLSLSNLFGLVTGPVESLGGVAGAAVRRHLTYARFLDAGNFASGSNPQADPAQEVVQNFIVERMVSLTAEKAVFELAAPAESDGSLAPARLMTADRCPWQYRGAECGYTGRAVADRFDMPTDDPSKDACSGKITGCRARYGLTADLPFGGFVSADKVLS